MSVICQQLHCSLIPRTLSNVFFFQNEIFTNHPDAWIQSWTWLFMRQNIMLINWAPGMTGSLFSFTPSWDCGSRLLVSRTTRADLAGHICRTWEAKWKLRDPICWGVMTVLFEGRKGSSGAAGIFRRDLLAFLLLPSDRCVNSIISKEVWINNWLHAQAHPKKRQIVAGSHSFCPSLTFSLFL